VVFHVTVHKFVVSGCLSQTLEDDFEVEWDVIC
jgi:hypothetical protein